MIFFTEMGGNVFKEGVPDAPAGLGDFLHFAFTGAFPHLIYSHANVVGVELKKWCGLIPSPATNSVAIVEQVYREISEICQSNGSRMIVLEISDKEWAGSDEEGRNANTEAELLAAKGTPNSIFVDGDKALLAQLTESGRAAYAKAYMHFRGDPPRLIDTHPNRRAHSVLAQALAEAIQKDLRENPFPASPR